MSSRCWLALAIMECIMSVHYLETGDNLTSDFTGLLMTVCLLIGIWLDGREHRGKDL